MKENKKSLVITHPEIAKEWHPTKNGSLKPTDVTAGSHKKVWWMCENGHEWEAIIYSVTNGAGCPYCSGRLAITDINDLATTYPEIAKQWHLTKNGNLKPTDIHAGSGKKVWWICEHGHEWQDVVRNRIKCPTCPICSGRKILTGFNDLATTHPELAKEWHPTKNGNLKPTNIIACGHKKVWWKCKYGHEWETSIISRKKGTACPYCQNRKVLIGFNDLSTTHPELAKQWHPTKNGELKPTNVTYGFNKKVWWICEHGHEWYVSPNSRTGSNTGCPYCSSHGMSKPEVILLHYIKKYSDCDVIHRYRKFGFEIDVFIKDKNIGIEYDGVYFHSGNTKKDLQKNQDCQEHGIKLYRIRENGLPLLNSSSVDFYYNAGNAKALSCIIQKIIQDIFNKQVTVDVMADAQIINSLIITTKQENSILVTHPELAKQWHPTKNKTLKPCHVSYGSTQKVWWICEHGHEWQAKTSERTKGYNCPYCSGRRIASGINDLATTHPELAKQWHPTKNGDLKPTDVIAGSGKKVWWLCEQGHEWEGSIVGRRNNHNCPYCQNKKVLVGFNDLATTHPELAKQWHPTKNGDLKPTDVTAGSGKKVWWLCEQGHEWEAHISDRTRDDGATGCPFCKGKKPIIGYNDLATKYPEIARQWHPTKNGNLTPSDVFPRSEKKVWWVDKKGKEFVRMVKIMTLQYDKVA